MQKDTKDKEISDLLKLDDESLYEKIGRELLGKQAFGLSSKQCINAGIKYMGEKQEMLAEIICYNEKIKCLFKNNNGLKDIIIVVAETIADNIIGMPVLSVSTLIVKRGLITLCKRHW